MAKQKKRETVEETNVASVESAAPAAVMPESETAMTTTTETETVVATTTESEIEATTTESATTESDSAEAPAEPQGRDRIQQQLEALKQREAELRRELAMADHPTLADAIRSIEGRAYGVSRVEAKMAAGLSKAELRRKETLEKKLAVALERRAEIDAQITALELELKPLGDARLDAFQAERAVALGELVEMLRTHEASLTSAQLDITMLVPALSAWRSEIAILSTTN